MSRAVDAEQTPLWAPARWVETDKGDQRCRVLADRHYTRQTPGDRQWTRPGYNQVLYFEDSRGDAVFCWWRPKYEDGIERRDGLHAIECTIFRNESAALSSELIIDACAVLRCWRYYRHALVITAVNAEATAARRGRRAQPGECFRRAGFVDLEHDVGRSSRRNAPNVWLELPSWEEPPARRAAWEPRGQVAMHLDNEETA